MPELPEIETIKNGILPLIKNNTVNKVIVRNQKLRSPIPRDLVKKIKWQKIKNISRRGKYLIFHFKCGFLLMHLGMSGSLVIVKDGASPKKHDHVDICFTDGYCLRFNDPRRFGCILWSDNNPSQHKLLHNLGAEPLSEEFNGDYLFARTCKSVRPIKLMLMDSKVIAGIGNIYANEALFKASIHPQSVAKCLTKSQCEKLVRAIKQVLTAAIRAGGTSCRDYKRADGTQGYFQQKLLVYGRGGKPCRKCKAILKTSCLGQRSTVFCPRCQKTKK